MVGRLARFIPVPPRVPCILYPVPDAPNREISTIIRNVSLDLPGKFRVGTDRDGSKVGWDGVRYAGGDVCKFMKSVNPGRLGRVFRLA